MNSVLQQFFMIPTLRFHFLGVEKKIVTEEEAKAEPRALEYYNMFKMFQEVLANLELSHQTMYDTKKFCEYYKDYNFEEAKAVPMKLGEQRDSQEFLTEFLYRLEEALKGTSRENLIKDTFGFETCT